MEIVLRCKFARLSLILIEILAFLLVVGWISKIYIASVISSKTSVANLKLAIKLDPGNAAYHLQLGRLYEYLPTDAQPEKAMAEFRLAEELSPYDPEAWINLGGAAEFAGNVTVAEEYLRHADYLAPRIPTYQWPIGNFYLLHGNVLEAFAHFKMVLAGTRVYDRTVFRTAWKASSDADQILKQLIPEDLAAEFSYLNYLVANNKFPATIAVWKRILRTPGKFQPDQAADYIDNLIGNRLPEDAFKVWEDLEKKGLMRYVASRADGKLITNGDFEENLLNMGFAWRISPVDEVFVGLDPTTYHSPNHALLVQFPGKQNLNYRQVFQYIKVNPGTTYRLQAFMKTDGITTDSGPRLEVRDAYDPSALDKFTDDLTGGTEGWTHFLLDFKTGPRTELLIISLTRLPSQKLDNLIAGRVWLDDVQLTCLEK
jgi:tetratricopeptide (TPR) repeat protein